MKPIIIIINIGTMYLVAKIAFDPLILYTPYPHLVFFCNSLLLALTSIEAVMKNLKSASGIIS